MDFIYICRNGANEELRYSIRSLVHFYPDANIHIVGGKPSWYIGNFTPVDDIGNKFNNINNCYKKICDLGIDDFILMNDDFYFINRPDKLEYYYDGLLNNKIEIHTMQYGLSKYARVLRDAEKALNSLGIDSPLNYDIHVPMLFNSDKLSKILDLSFAPRSVYGNIYGVGGINIRDVKVYKQSINIINSQYFLSSEDNSFNRILPLLSQKFTEKTIYES